MSDINVLAMDKFYSRYAYKFLIEIGGKEYSGEFWSSTDYNGKTLQGIDWETISPPLFDRDKLIAAIKDSM